MPMEWSSPIVAIHDSAHDPLAQEAIPGACEAGSSLPLRHDPTYRSDHDNDESIFDKSSLSSSTVPSSTPSPSPSLVHYPNDPSLLPTFTPPIGSSPFTRPTHEPQQQRTAETEATRLATSRLNNNKQSPSGPSSSSLPSSQQSMPQVGDPAVTVMPPLTSVVLSLSNVDSNNKSSPVLAAPLTTTPSTSLSNQQQQQQHDTPLSVIAAYMVLFTCAVVFALLACKYFQRLVISMAN
jgi:hypothetical protein